jgi:hypothetical protein
VESNALAAKTVATAILACAGAAFFVLLSVGTFHKNLQLAVKIEKVIAGVHFPVPLISNDYSLW